MADTINGRENRRNLLSDQVVALKEAIHTDIILNPGDNGPGIPTHKVFLALRSNVFRNMLESDECKGLPEASITIPDMSYKELKSLLEFFYSGTLSPTNKHIAALYLAADKYDIPSLQDICRETLTSSLSHDNVLDIIELSAIPSDTILKKAATEFFIENIYYIIDSKRYESFEAKNQSLSLEIMGATIRRFLKHSVQYYHNQY